VRKGDRAWSLFAISLLSAPVLFFIAFDLPAWLAAVGCAAVVLLAFVAATTRRPDTAVRAH